MSDAQNPQRAYALDSSQIAQYHDVGYVKTDSRLTVRELQRLRSACDRVVSRARSGLWPHKRNWPYNHFKGSSADDFWGVHHLLHPELEEPAFLDYVARPSVRWPVMSLLDVPDRCWRQQLQLENVNLLVNPSIADFAIRWHRDLIRIDLDPEAEVQELGKRQYSIRWNLALFEDPCLFVIPGSHRRPKTVDERSAYQSHSQAPLPGEVNVVLQPGEAIFYDVNILHKGIYTTQRKRATLHCSMGLADGWSERDELYESLSWLCDKPQMRASLPAELTPLWENFCRMHALWRAKKGSK